MGWFQRFVAFISCKSCKNYDERGLKRRNGLRKKLGKNKIEPGASTELDIKVENVSPSARHLDHFVVSDERGDELTPKDKWASPRVPSQASIRSGATSASSLVSDISRAASARAKRAIETAYNQVKEELRLIEIEKEKKKAEMVKNRGGAEDGGIICDRIPSRASMRSGAASASSFVSNISRAASACVRRAIDTASNQIIKERKLIEKQKKAAEMEAEKNRGEAEGDGGVDDKIVVEDLEANGDVMEAAAVGKQ